MKWINNNPKKNRQILCAPENKNNVLNTDRKKTNGFSTPQWEKESSATRLHKLQNIFMKNLQFNWKSSDTYAERKTDKQDPAIEREREWEIKSVHSIDDDYDGKKWFWKKSERVKRIRWKRRECVIRRYCLISNNDRAFDNTFNTIRHLSHNIKVVIIYRRLQHSLWARARVCVCAWALVRIPIFFSWVCVFCHWGFARIVVDR